MGEFVSHIYIQMKMEMTNELQDLFIVILIVGIFMPAIFLGLIQFVWKKGRQKVVQKRVDREPICKVSKRVILWLYIGMFTAMIGAMCCFSADAHGILYDTLLSMQHTNENNSYNAVLSLNDVYVEGTVAKIEEKSKRWIYLKMLQFNLQMDCMQRGKVLLFCFLRLAMTHRDRLLEAKLGSRANYLCFHRLPIRANLIQGVIITA